MSARVSISIPGLTPLEDEVLRLLMAAHPDQARLLADQFARAAIRSRRLTGVGFFLNFTVAGGERFESANFELNDVYATIDALDAGAGFQLFVRNGLIDFLEGYTFEGPWPDADDGWQVFVRSPDRGPLH